MENVQPNSFIHSFHNSLPDWYAATARYDRHLRCHHHRLRNYRCWIQIGFSHLIRNDSPSPPPPPSSLLPPSSSKERGLRWASISLIGCPIFHVWYQMQRFIFVSNRPSGQFHQLCQLHFLPPISLSPPLNSPQSTWSWWMQQISFDSLIIDRLDCYHVANFELGATPHRSEGQIMLWCPQASSWLQLNLAGSQRIRVDSCGRQLPLSHWPKLLKTDPGATLSLRLWSAVQIAKNSPRLSFRESLASLAHPLTIPVWRNPRQLLAHVSGNCDSITGGANPSAR